MNTGGEAADQVIRMSLNGAEVALKITGVAAKEVATLLVAILKDNKKSKGRTRLENLIKTGRPLTIFTVKVDDYDQFKQEAKRYGILYCAVRNAKGTDDGMVDIMVKQEDISRVDRIVDRFKFADVSQSIFLPIRPRLCRIKFNIPTSVPNINLKIKAVTVIGIIQGIIKSPRMGLESRKF